MSDQRISSRPIASPLQYCRGGVGRDRSHRIIAITIAAALIVLVVVRSVLPTLGRPHDHDPRVRCTSNLKQIGLGAIMYANTVGGRFPDDLETLMDTQDLVPNVLMCPSATGDVPTGPTTREIVSSMRQSNLISYVYLGKGLRLEASSDTVLAYERSIAHGNCINVLFVDGHVDCLDANEALVVMKQATAGVSPIRFPIPPDPSTTQPATRGL